MKFPVREIRRARIEIIPMIDTIFFLLVFFMITSLSMVRMKALAVALPKNTPPSAANASSGETPDRSHLVILTVSDIGGYYVGTRRVAPESLGAALQARAASDPHSVVVLNLAKSQTAQTLIQVMDTVNRVRTPDGQPVTALMATEPVDQNGRALTVPPLPRAISRVSP
jgi:biopolymer transport protein ExbD